MIWKFSLVGEKFILHSNFLINDNNGILSYILNFYHTCVIHSVYLSFFTHSIQFSNQFNSTQLKVLSICSVFNVHSTQTTDIQTVSTMYNKYILYKYNIVKKSGWKAKCKFSLYMYLQSTVYGVRPYQIISY